MEGCRLSRDGLARQGPAATTRLFLCGYVPRRRYARGQTLRKRRKRPILNLDMPAENLINAPEFTVSELSSALKRTVEDAYGHVRVRGEISGFRGPHSSGHCYFALKDESAKIEAVIWKFAHARMRFKPQEGLEVIATGKLTTYPGSSKYQIVIEALEPAGIGALMALMEERKKKLAAEGLFDEARKQLLPWLPEVIGVVTSPTGAVIRDILHRLEDRFPRRVLVWPVKVQGEGSAEQIAAAIRGFNALARGRQNSAAGSADRRARRRLAGRSLVVQRGDRGPRRRRQHDPADLGGRPRDRHHADRFCRRQARADADGGRRNGGAGAQRIVRRGRRRWRGARWCAGSAARKAAATNCAPRRAHCPRAGESAGDPAAAAGQRGRRPAPRTEGQHQRASSPLRAGQRAADAAGAARPGRAGPPAPDRIRRAASRFPPARCCATAGIALPGSRSGSRPRSSPTRRRSAMPSRATANARNGWPNARAARSSTLMQRLEARVAHSGQLLSALSYRGVLARGFALVRDEHGHARACRGSRRTRARICRSNSPTAALAAPRTRIGRRQLRRRPASRVAREPKPAAPKRASKAGRSGKFVLAVAAFSPHARSLRLKTLWLTAPAIPRRAFANPRALRRRCRYGRVPATPRPTVPAIACSGKLARSKS